jgi:hypothetical protein
MAETWRPVYGFGADFYEVSNLGRVRSVVTRKGIAKGTILKGTIAVGSCQIR